MEPSLFGLCQIVMSGFASRLRFIPVLSDMGILVFIVLGLAIYLNVKADHFNDQDITEIHHI